ncbi:hypothetical protein Hanom_Chr15g01364331 [Helianthus anomalus]
MASIPWMQKEDITLCESWVQTLSHYTPRIRSSGPFWGSILQHFSIHRVDHTRTIDALSSCFRTIHMDCERFEQLHIAVEHQGSDLGKDDTIQVALIDYRHEVGREFKHVSE